MPTKKRLAAGVKRRASTILYTSAFLVLLSLAAAMALSGNRQKATQSVSAAPESTPFVDPISSIRPATSAPPDGTSPSHIQKDPSQTGKPQKAAPAIKRTSERPVPKSKGVLVFVIDDAGHNEWQLTPFLDLPGPVTIAVLPGLPYTVKAGEMVKTAGKELILHQPMEALGGLDPGPGAIRADMDDETIRSILRRNLAELPGVVGMNNHMGSKATADVRVMSTVLDEVSNKGLYFLDSLTIGDSVVHSVASLMRQHTWERTVFLDNTPDKASILHYIEEGTKVAEKRGYAVMIGHVWSSELAQTLADLYPLLMEQGFSLSTISRIMMDTDDNDDIGD